jgi:hypothetical protein
MRLETAARLTKSFIRDAKTHPIMETTLIQTPGKANQSFGKNHQLIYRESLPGVISYSAQDPQSLTR